MADFSLKVSKSDYEDKLVILEHCISELSGIRGEYYTLMGQLDADVMESSDDAFAQLESNVYANIRAVELSLKRAEEARQAVMTSLKGYEELQANTGNMLNSAGEMMQNAIDAATKVSSLF